MKSTDRPSVRPPVRLVLVYPHTHWDREWYEPAAVFRQRLVAALDDLIAILERDSRFTCFVLDGQTVLVEDYLEVRPEQRPRVARLVRGGRLLVGPWFILADELLSSDEALTRNLLLGRDAAGLGRPMPVGYSPDAFGHPATLPAILAGFGIANAILWRGYGGEPGQDGDLFRWRAPDGSEVTVSHLPPPGYEVGAGLPATAPALRRRWRELQDLLLPRALGPAVLLPAGADHHAADPDLPRQVARLNRLFPRYRFRIGAPPEFFAAIPRDLPLPAVSGELRFSYRYTWTLQGVHSTRAGLKRAVSEADRLLVGWAEPQAALAAMAGGRDRRPELRAAWREHLLNHFHDSFCGCTSDVVADEVCRRAMSVALQARAILVDALHDRLKQDRNRARREPRRWKPALVVVNPVPRPRSQVVEATITAFVEHVRVGAPAPSGVPAVPAIPALYSPGGRPVPLQLLAEYDAYERLDSPGNYPDQDRVRAFRVAVLPGQVGPLGTLSLTVGPAGAGNPSVPDPVRAAGAELSTAGRDLVVQAGDTVTLRDRGTGVALAPLLQLESEADRGDTYTFDPVPGDRARRAEWVGSVRAVWPGPLVAALARDWEIPGRARGTVFFRLESGSRLVRIAIEGTNLSGDHRLRVVFPLPSGSPERVIADMQYGPVSRERRVFHARDYPREFPATTAPFHRWVSARTALSPEGQDAGVTVFSRGAFEYEATDRGGIAITLLRAVGELSRADLRTRPGHAAWPQPTPGAQEAGPFRLELGVATLAVSETSGPAEWDALERVAGEFHASCAGLMVRHARDIPRQLPGPLLGGAGLAFKSLKPAEGGKAVVARCVNQTGKTVEGSWTWPARIRRAFLARLDEKPLERLPVSRDGRQVRFTAAPRAIVTVVVES